MVFTFSICGDMLCVQCLSGERMRPTWAVTKYSDYSLDQSVLWICRYTTQHSIFENMDISIVTVESSPKLYHRWFLSCLLSWAFSSWYFSWINGDWISNCRELARGGLPTWVLGWGANNSSPYKLALLWKGYDWLSAGLILWCNLSNGKRAWNLVHGI
jgi:hypothetical protein